jgi:hypothetical protein
MLVNQKKRKSHAQDLTLDHEREQKDEDIHPLHLVTRNIIAEMTAEIAKRDGQGLVRTLAPETESIEGETLDQGLILLKEDIILGPDHPKTVRGLYPSNWERYSKGR